jgi:serine/threonine-protein kinase
VSGRLTVAPGLADEIQVALGAAYVVERELPGGGMAHLFVATETALGRRVALKVLPAHLSASLDAARFRREIQLAARLTHPNIVPLLAAGEAAGLLYYTMPFVEGESLRARLDRDGQLPIAEVVSVLRDLARALAYAHAHHVVHRDLKPDNVLLAQGTALLTDFGIAKAVDAATTATTERTAAGIAVGTPTYVSPEQAAGDPELDQRTDLYSLGVVAYEMLAGRPPFTYRALQALLAAHRSEAPLPIATQRPGTPPWLAQLVTRLLAKPPAERPQSADEVLHVFDAAVTVSDGALVTSNTGQNRGASPPVWRAHRVPLTGAGALVLLLLAFTPGVYGLRHASVEPSRPAGTAARASTAQRPEPASGAVAVLAFATVGRDSVEQVFSEGLADDLTSALGALPGLRVASRTSVATLQGRQFSAVAIADSLGVGRVLEGTVERSDGRLRVTAQLTNARDGLALWSATYERPARDVFALQDEIADDIVRALAARAAPAPGR